MGHKRTGRKPGAGVMSQFEKNNNSGISINSDSRLIDWTRKQTERDAVGVAAMLLSADPDLAVRLPATLGEDFVATALASWTDSGVLNLNSVGDFRCNFGSSMAKMVDVATGVVGIGTAVPSHSTQRESIIKPDIAPLMVMYRTSALVVRISAAVSLTGTEGAWAACCYSGPNPPTSIAECMKWPMAYRGTVNDLAGNTVSLPLMPSAQSLQEQTSGRGGTASADVLVDGGNWKMHEVFTRYAPASGSLDACDAWDHTCSKIAFMVSGGLVGAEFTVDVQRVIEYVPKVPFVQAAFPAMEEASSAATGVELATLVAGTEGSTMNAPHNPARVSFGVPASHAELADRADAKIARAQGADPPSPEEAFLASVSQAVNGLTLAAKISRTGGLEEAVAKAIAVANLLLTQLAPKQRHVLRPSAKQVPARAGALVSLSKKKHELGELGTAVDSLAKYARSIHGSSFTKQFEKALPAGASHRMDKGLNTILTMLDGAGPVVDAVAPMVERALLAFL